MPLGGGVLQGRGNNHHGVGLMSHFTALNHPSIAATILGWDESDDYQTARFPGGTDAAIAAPADGALTADQVEGIYDSRYPIAFTWHLHTTSPEETFLADEEHNQVWECRS